MYSIKFCGTLVRFNMHYILSHGRELKALVMSNVSISFVLCSSLTLIIALVTPAFSIAN